ncbi:MAG: YcxB family protein [Bacillales bacterium]|jgi:hypothetical protein|nr:YcxB family protein [Bacillales bacterium]
MNKKYSLTLKDYIKYNFLFTRVLVQLIIYFVLVLLLAFFITFSRHKDSEVLFTGPFILEALLYFVIGYVFILIYIGLLTFIGTKRAYKRNLDVSQNIELEFGEHSVKQINENGVVELKYLELYKIIIKAGLIVLLVAPQQGIIIPKREFNEEEYNTLLLWFKNKDLDIKKNLDSLDGKEEVVIEDKKD